MTEPGLCCCRRDLSLHSQHAAQCRRYPGESAAFRRHAISGKPSFGMGSHRPHGGLEQNGVDGRLEIVVGDKLQDAPAAFRHLGAL